MIRIDDSASDLNRGHERSWHADHNLAGARTHVVEHDRGRADALWPSLEPVLAFVNAFDHEPSVLGGYDLTVVDVLSLRFLVLKSNRPAGKWPSDLVEHTAADCEQRRKDVIPARLLALLSHEPR